MVGTALIVGGPHDGARVLARAVRMERPAKHGVVHAYKMQHVVRDEPHAPELCYVYKGAYRRKAGSTDHWGDPV